MAEGAEMESIVLLSVLLVLLFSQLGYYIKHYGRVVAYRNPPKSDEAEGVGISVVVPLFDADFGFLDYRLPRLLEQKHERYEVVVVDVTGDEEFADRLKLLRINHPRLTSTRLRVDPLYPITTKMALNVGIKAACYDHIIFTLPDCAPVSARWAGVFARAFVGHDVVLGYASLDATKGLWSGIIRTASFARSLPWLSSAIAHRTYRGTLCNMGLTKQVYFAAKGFNFLNLNMGEDDLFVSKIATRENTAVVLGAASKVEQRAWGGLGWWAERRTRLSHTHRFYSKRAKWAMSWESWCRVLFFASAVAALCLLPVAGKVVAGVALVLRAAVVLFMTHRVACRLSERRVVAPYLLYDLFGPVGGVVVALRRRLAPKHKRH